LAGQLEEAAERCGVPREDRPFHAHVTVARVKFPDRARELISRLEELSASAVSEPFAAPSVTLYRSELDPRGARYSVIERRELPAG
jgi:RNA 2',3'-cyclic 3'-phosphodiesterase